MVRVINAKSYSGVDVKLCGWAQFIKSNEFLGFWLIEESYMNWSCWILDLFDQYTTDGQFRGSFWRE